MAIFEIRVTSVEADPVGRDVRQEVVRTLGLNSLTEVRTTKVYRVEGATEDEARRLAAELLTDPITETYVVGGPAELGTSNVVEVAYKPGVMNPEAASIMKAASDLGIDLAAADSSREYGFIGDISEAEQNTIVARLLVNKVVEQVVTEKPVTLTFEGQVGPINTVPIRHVSEEELMELSKDKLFLNAEEMKVIQDHFKKLDRDPTDAELEIIAARWSEHCGHKTFNAKVMVDGVEKPPLIDRIVKAAEAHFGDLVVSAFSDNSGVIRFYDGQAIAGKVETHNSPSAIEPYGGAMTGSGGLFRDILGTGQGAETIISTDMFCLGPPDLDPALLPPGTLPPDYLFRRVIQGVRDYGNRMGIPTANGSVHFHPDFRAKPTVIVGGYGIMPEARAEKGEPLVGDQVVIIGGRTGRDGIHGATFSSGEMTERTASVNSSAVQIGNAIEEQRMSRAILEARDWGLVRAITDCGAAGFSSAVGEMAENIGATVDISKVPLKYPGLAPWEIWLSESQERMVLAVAPESMEALLEICRKYNVEAVAIGEFDGSNSLTVNYGYQTVADLDYEFLKNGLPQREMEARWIPEVLPEIRPEAPNSEEEWVQRLKAVLSHGNVCSKEPIVRQYDHGVQGGNVVSPFGGVDQDGPNDALVIRPILGKPYGLVQSHGMNPILNRLDPYKGTVWAITEAAANYVSAGGDIEEAAAVGNYIWPFPDEEAMGSLDRSVDAAVDMMHALKLPVISGKDSLSSTYRGKDGQVIKIPPVYTASIFGRIPDVEKTMTTDIKRPGKSQLLLVGNPSDKMGGSTYYDVTGGSSNDQPDIDTSKLLTTLQQMHKAIKSGQVLSCHDISEGGLATAITEMGIGGNCGISLKIPTEADAEAFLFSETAGCFVIEVQDKHLVEKYFKDTPVIELGYTLPTKLGRRLSVSVGDDPYGPSKELFQVSMYDLAEAWQAPMKEIFH